MKKGNSPKAVLNSYIPAWTMYMCGLGLWSWESQ